MAKSTKRGGLGADALFSTPSAPPAAASPKEEQPPAPAPEIEFKKFTCPLRSDQLEDLTTVIAQIYLAHRVDLSKAVLIRYGLSMVLSMAKEDPDRLLQALQQFEADELGMNGNRSHSLAPGLANYRTK